MGTVSLMLFFDCLSCVYLRRHQCDKKSKNPQQSKTVFSLLL